MTNVVTVLGDHKGMTTPKVSGDEYYVDAKVNVTDYRGAAALTPTGTFDADANTFTRASGSLIAGLEVGASITISNAEDGGNNATVYITSNDGTTLGLSAVAAAESGDAITITPDYETLTAASFGLSTINSMMVLGSESSTLLLTQHLHTDGTNLRGLNKRAVEMKVLAIANGANQALNADAGMFLVRVYGNL